MLRDVYEHKEKCAKLFMAPKKAKKRHKSSK